MTNTIPNVPRELLERLAEYAPAGFCAPTALQGFALEARRLLSAPSPAGVDGLEAVGHIDSDDDVSGSYAVFRNDCDLRDGTELVRLPDAQTIIDGLRGKVAELESTLADNLELSGKRAVRIAEIGHELADAISERDQQAKRIGELEGLLRAESARVDFLDAYIVTAEALDTGKVAMLADSGTLRECIDAARRSKGVV